MIEIGRILIVAGAAVLVLAAWGVIVLPDALGRQHAATKAGTLAMALLALGAALVAGQMAWAWRIGAIVLLLFVTMPFAAQALARAAVWEQGLADQAAAARRVKRP